MVGVGAVCSHLRGQGRKKAGRRWWRGGTQAGRRGWQGERRWTCAVRAGLGGLGPAWWMGLGWSCAFFFGGGGPLGEEGLFSEGRAGRWHGTEEDRGSCTPLQTPARLSIHADS
eukprot:scaffold86885_cov26-Tisochrysis_lutea.AAC.6